jgi:hypothetical protein
MALALLDHADALSAINTDQDAAVARDVGSLVGRYGGRSDLAHATHTMLPDIIDMHAHIAGTLTANWYDGIDPGSAFKAKPYTDIPREQISKMIDWALHAPGEEPVDSRLVGSSQRLVRGVSRQTVVRNAAKEGVRYARHAKEDACAFCRALAIRGSGREDQKYLYHSEQSAKFRKSDGEKYHTNCGCEPVPIRAGQIWTPPDYAKDWEKQYADARRKTKPGDKFFARIVEQMRQDEPKPEPEAEEDETDTGATIHQFPTPDAEHLKLRAALDEASDFPAIQKAAAELLPDTRVDLGPEVLLRQADMGSPSLWDRKAPAVQENLKAMVRAADDITTKYPELELDALRTLPDTQFAHPGIYGHTDVVPAHPGSHLVAMNRSWLVNTATLEDSWKTGLDTGFHYPGTDNPIYDIMVHELGHVMHRNARDRGVDVTDDDISRALVTHFITEVDDNSGAATPMGPSRNARYREWLADNLSGYSTHHVTERKGRRNSPDVSGAAPIHGREALAEAFADVEINGDDAADTSKVLHGLLVSAFTEAMRQGSDDGLSTAV